MEKAFLSPPTPLTQIYQIMKLPELIHYFFFNQDSQFCTAIISNSTL